MLRHDAVCLVCGGALSASGRLAGICPACALSDAASDEDAGSDASGASGTFRVGNYEIMEELARGGMGIVYRARQLAPARQVALKMLLPHLLRSPAVIERFRVEARVLAELGHSAILPVYEAGEFDGMPFFSMKLATGGTLAQRKAQFRDRPRAAAELAALLADAVQFAHERGVLHRDLKPGNILFDEGDRPYVSDFGLAKLAGIETNLTRTTDFFGTPLYTAPEVAAASTRAATISSDIYALGAILYELLAGRPPFEAENAPALLQKIAESEPARIRNAPRDLETVCLKALAREPSRRYATAGEFANDLRRWLEGRPVVARPAGPGERALAWARRKPALASLSALLGCALISGAVLEMRNSAKLRVALTESHAAQRAAQESLQRALLTQARAQRQTGRLGQRFDALESLRRAAAIEPSIEARSEAAAALAMPDLRIGPRHRQIFFADSFGTLDFSSDLRRYLVAHPKGGFVVRESPGGKELLRLAEHQSQPAQQLRFSPSERFGIVTYADGAVEVWSLEEQKILWQHRGFGATAAIVALLSNESEIAVAAPDGSVDAHRFSDRTERRLVSPGLPVLQLSASRDGQLLVVAGRNALEVRAVASGELVWSARGDFTAAEPAWSSDGRFLAGGSAADGEIHIWDTARGEVQCRLRAESFWPIRMSFHPDGRTLASVSTDRALRFWDMRTGVVRLKTSGAPRVLRFAADGHQLALAPEHLSAAIAEFALPTVWREFAGGAIRNEQLAGVAISPDDRLVATCSRSGITLWDTRAGEMIGAVETGQAGGSSVFFHPDGRTIIYSTAGDGIFRRAYRVVSGEGNARARVELGEAEQLGTATDGLLTGLGPNGRQWIVEDRAQRRVDLWPDGQREQARSLIRGERFNGAPLSPNGRWLATLNAPFGGVTIWNAGTGAKEHDLDLSRSHAACAFSPDGRWLLTGTATEYRVWSSATWETQQSWPADLGGLPRGRMFISPDGALVATQSADDSLQIRDTSDFRELITLTAPAAIGIIDAAWSSDRRKLFVLGAGHRLYEWNLSALHEELAQLRLEW